MKFNITEFLKCINSKKRAKALKNKFNISDKEWCLIKNKYEQKSYEVIDDYIHFAINTDGKDKPLIEQQISQQPTSVKEKEPSKEIMNPKQSQEVSNPKWCYEYNFQSSSSKISGEGPMPKELVDSSSCSIRGDFYVKGAIAFGIVSIAIIKIISIIQSQKNQS